jgi:tight adherence protein C
MRVERQVSDLHEIAQLASLLSVAFDSGLGVVAALEEVIPKSRGRNSLKLQRLLDALKFGGNLYEELDLLRDPSRNPALDALTLKLQATLQFGTPIANQLSALARSNRSTIAQFQLTEASKRETLMLLPLVFLILPVTVLFAIYPSTQYLNLNY